jgi:hypothetical protein
MPRKRLEVKRLEHRMATKRNRTGFHVKAKIQQLTPDPAADPCILPIIPTRSPVFPSPPTRCCRGNPSATRPCGRCYGRTRRNVLGSRSSKNLAESEPGRLVRSMRPGLGISPKSRGRNYLGIQARPRESDSWLPERNRHQCRIAGESRKFAPRMVQNGIDDRIDG